MSDRMKILFSGAVQDSLGYGEFARGFVCALDSLGADVQIAPISLESQKIDHGPKGRVCSKIALKKQVPPDVNIVCMIPELFSRFKKPNCKNVGFTMWETDRLPQNWVDCCNDMDGIMVPCQWNKEVFVKSGVTVPVAVVCPGIDIPKNVEIKKDFDGLSFYTIGQFTERKNFKGLIRAYWAAFSGQDDVRLVLKTHRQDYSEVERNKILAELAELRETVSLPHYPSIVFMGQLMPRRAIDVLHAKNDCFVSAHRSEGLGLGLMEAMSHGNMVIGTDFSGNTEFMTDYNSLLIDYQMTPVSNMQWLSQWYKGDMLWAEPDLAQLAKAMRLVYDDREFAKMRGSAARDWLKEHFTWESAASKLVGEVEKMMLKL